MIFVKLTVNIRIDVLFYYKEHIILLPYLILKILQQDILMGFNSSYSKDTLNYFNLPRGWLINIEAQWSMEWCSISERWDGLRMSCRCWMPLLNLICSIIIRPKRICRKDLAFWNLVWNVVCWHVALDNRRPNPSHTINFHIEMRKSNDI